MARSCVQFPLQPHAVEESRRRSLSPAVQTARTPGRWATVVRAPAMPSSLSVEPPHMARSCVQFPPQPSCRDNCYPAHMQASASEVFTSATPSQTTELAIQASSKAFAPTPRQTPRELPIEIAVEVVAPPLQSPAFGRSPLPQELSLRLGDLIVPLPALELTDEEEHGTVQPLQSPTFGRCPLPQELGPPLGDLVVPLPALKSEDDDGVSTATASPRSSGIEDPISRSTASTATLLPSSPNVYESLMRSNDGSTASTPTLLLSPATTIAPDTFADLDGALALQTGESSMTIAPVRFLFGAEDV